MGQNQITAQIPAGISTYLSQEHLQHGRQVIGTHIAQVDQMGTRFEALQQLAHPRGHASHAIDSRSGYAATLYFQGAFDHEQRDTLLRGQRLQVQVHDGRSRWQRRLWTHDGHLLQALLVANESTLSGQNGQKSKVKFQQESFNKEF